jgi:apolipoprotein D and lipocalin family protein
MDTQNIAKHVDLNRYFTAWYVMAGRLTAFEKNTHNAIEHYHWNAKKKQIDVMYTALKQNGKLRKLPQKAWVVEDGSNAHWKVQFLWPFKADYLILAVDPDYKWVAVGCHNQKYLWIMASRPEMSEAQLALILKKVEKLNYRIDEVKRVEQSW